MPRAVPLEAMGPMLQVDSELEVRLKAAPSPVSIDIVYTGWHSFLAYYLFSKCPLNAPAGHKYSHRNLDNYVHCGSERRQGFWQEWVGDRKRLFIIVTAKIV